MTYWDRVKMMLVFAGVVLAVAMVNSAVREHDPPVALIAAGFAAACFGGAALIHRYR